LEFVNGGARDFAEIRVSKSNPKQAAVRMRRYLASLPPDSRRHVKKLREIIRGVAPGAIEVMSYGMPAFKLDGRVLVYYAGWREHCSVYPMTEAIRRAYTEALKGYETSKGTVKFPIAKPLPVALVRRLVKARIAAIRTRPKLKTLV
jgi:uncharacterized protein YdhG (YjbR/CyaY superfamily)